MSTVRIVLVEDHDLVRAGLRDFLAPFSRYEVVGEARTARSAFQIIESMRPDVVLMDIALPGMDGVVATREILRRRPGTKVVILSAHHQSHDVRDALSAGALGYALKGDPPDTVIEALEKVARGVRYLPPSLAARFAVHEVVPMRDVLDILSVREHEIFRLAVECRPAAEIAQQLCVARKTVDTHLNRINRKLGVRDRAELVRLAAGLGLVHSIRPSFAIQRR